MHLASPHDIWIFGYGSLMWRPGFPYAERSEATVVGYHRAFCVRSTHHRGSPGRPGLVLGLDRGGACHGIAYRVAAAEVPATIAYLRERELIYGVYLEAHVPALLTSAGPDGGHRHREVEALAYVVERRHPSYSGALPLNRQATLIRGARGISGDNLDYLINTVRHLRELSIREPELERLMTLAGPFAARTPGDGPARPSVAGLRKVWARAAARIRRVSHDEQRRFAHRLRMGDRW